MFASIPLDEIKPSPLNPRASMDPAQLKELVQSVREHGVIQPIVVREAKKGSGYELVAGHRRFAAAKAAELDKIPAVKRELTDTEVLEIMISENSQRADLHPLEEAQGYFQLSKQPGYDVTKIATRVGRSAKYVYDRIKLLQLTKEAKKLFLENKFSAGHAILLARLKPADQARALELNRYGNSGVFQAEHLLWNPNETEEAGDEESFKPRSVREMQAWIDEHVRFDAKADADPMLFPDTATALQDAGEEKRKVVMITHESYVQPEARSEKERIFGPRSWKRADGEMTENERLRKVKSKTCEKSVLGLVVVGPDRGESLLVCVNRTCEVHFPQAVKKAKKKAAAAKPGPDHWELERKKEAEKRVRWEKALPELRAALKAAIAKAPAGANGPLADVVLDELREYGSGGSLERGRTAEDFLRCAAGVAIFNRVQYGYNNTTLAKRAKAIGVDVAAILKKHAPETSAPKKAKKK